MSEKGQPLPYPLDECAGCRDLTQQLATVIAERDDYKKRAEWKHVHDDSLELELQNQLAQAQTDHDGIKTRLEIRVQELTSALDVLCQAIERGEQDEDYLRRRAAEGRMALAQGRGA